MMEEEQSRIVPVNQLVMNTVKVFLSSTVLNLELDSDTYQVIWPLVTYFAVKNLTLCRSEGPVEAHRPQQ